MSITESVTNTLRLVRQYRRAYLAINVVFYGLVACGLVACGMVYVTFHPEVQEMLTQAVLLSFTEGPLATVAEAYAGGEVLKAIALTFAVNFGIASLLVIFVPSLVTFLSAGCSSALRVRSCGDCCWLQRRLNSGQQ